MKAQDEFISTLPLPSDLHVAAVTQAISALMQHIAAPDHSYVHRMEVCRHLQNVVRGVSRGRRLICCHPEFFSIKLHLTPFTLLCVSSRGRTKTDFTFSAVK